MIGRDGGEAKAITSGRFDDREPCWSHDGSRIAFSSDRYGGITTIWEVTVANGDVHQISTREGWVPVWAADDQELTFVTMERGDPAHPIPAMHAVNVNGLDRLVMPVERDRAADTRPAAAAWSADGTQLAYVSQRGSLFVGTRRTITGAGPVFLGSSPVSVPQEDVFPFKPQWISPTEILYTANGRIMRRTVGGRASAIPFTANVSLQRSTYTIAHRALEPSEPQRVTGIVTPTVSPDGRAIAFIAMGDLFVMPIGGAPVQITNDEAVEIDPAWSPDSTRLAFASDHRGHMDLWMLDLAANRLSQLTEDRGAVSGPA